MPKEGMRPFFLRSIKRMGAIAKDAVFPTRCCSCGRLYHRHHQREVIGQQPSKAVFRLGDGLAELLCSNCIHQFDLVPAPICTQCGRFFESPLGVDHRCGRCLKEPFEFSMARSAGLYDQALKALICSYKYQYRAELAAPLARLLWRTLHRYWDLGQIDMIIPVPLHPQRLRKRGFNQAELMVRHWPGLARDQNLVFEKGKIAFDVLIRHRNTPSQTGLDRRRRVANLRHAFELSDSNLAQGRRVLLVDDVLTTGATANACARVLRRAKAASIGVLTLAHAV